MNVEILKIKPNDESKSIFEPFDPYPVEQYHNVVEMSVWLKWFSNRAIVFVPTDFDIGCLQFASFVSKFTKFMTEPVAIYGGSTISAKLVELDDLEQASVDPETDLLYDVYVRHQVDPLTYNVKKIYIARIGKVAIWKL